MSDAPKHWSEIAPRSAVATARSPSRRAHVVPMVLALSVVVAGCAVGPSRPSTAPAGPTTSAQAVMPAPPPQPAELCGGPTTPAQAFWLPAPGGALLQAAMLGTGPDTAVFLHVSGSRGLCGFWSYAEWLARTKGVRSVLFSQCGYDASQCPAPGKAKEWMAGARAAVAWAREHGARRITLVGASAGAVVALQIAASLEPRVDAVVSLSAELSWSGLDSLAAARRLEVPALFAIAPGDRYVTVGTTRRFYQATPVRSKRLVVMPEGAGHGWELLGSAAAGWSPLATTVATWIHDPH